MKRNSNRTEKRKNRHKSGAARPTSCARYARSISLDELMEKGGMKKHEPKQALELTVQGLRHGRICMEAEDGMQYFCSRENARGALFGDRVSAVPVDGDRVLVRRVLVHAHEHIVGVLRVRKNGLLLEPLERHLPSSIEVEGEGGTAKDGDIVRTRVTQWADRGELLVCVEEVIGSFTQATHALDGLIAAHHLRTDFSENVLSEAAALPAARLEDDPERVDLRGLLSFTIDGRDAKDFDDAISLERLDNGQFRLGVHIADVGYYVHEGSALDKEAFLRGTSVYFAGRVLPMLPEQLSNGVCSLRPNEDKFTLSAMMDITPQGEVADMRLLRSITCSNARLVYDDVNALFDGDPIQKERLSGVEAALLDMRALSRMLRERRQAQGSIDFDTDEPQFVLDEYGEPVEIVKRSRGEAEMLIEDFMLAANQAVARLARERKIALLYRVHEQPDPEKLQIFKEFLHGIGVDGRRLTRHAQPGDIRAILEATRAREEFGVISTLALRSMQKARYDVKPLGHYGLAMQDYCHFTSPIRRYPDLVVSRALTAMLTGNRVTLKGEALEDAAIRASDCERAAVEAERAAQKLMTARFMASHVGEVFSGTVSGVSEWGIYVALTNGAEGFIHVRTLEDWFAYDERRMTLRGERTGAVFSLGQTLEVRVEEVDLTTSSVDLVLTASLRPPKREKSERKKERARLRAFSR